MEGRFAPMAAAAVDFVNIIVPPIGDWMACDFHISWLELEEVLIDDTVVEKPFSVRFSPKIDWAPSVDVVAIVPDVLHLREYNSRSEQNVNDMNKLGVRCQGAAGYIQLVWIAVLR
jgi:hypothetical protein